MPDTRLALLHSDGSLTVFAPGFELDEAREEALDVDFNETEPAHFTKIVTVTISDAVLAEIPSLKSPEAKQ